jgi:hypothetical protein
MYNNKMVSAWILHLFSGFKTINNESLEQGMWNFEWRQTIVMTTNSEWYVNNPAATNMVTMQKFDVDIIYTYAYSFM